MDKPQRNDFCPFVGKAYNISICNTIDFYDKGREGKDNKS